MKAGRFFRGILMCTSSFLVLYIFFVKSDMKIFSLSLDLLFFSFIHSNLTSSENFVEFDNVENGIVNYVTYILCNLARSCKQKLLSFFKVLDI